MFSMLPFNYMFLFVMGLGTLFSVSSVHWLGIWAGLEMNLIGFLPMLVYQKSNSESESAVKYFVVQAMGSSFLMFGSLLVYSLSFSWEVFNNLQSLSMVGFIIMMSGLCIKLGVFPFHFWLPSVMAGLPWMTCLLLATWQKLAPLFLVMSLLEFNNSYWFIILICILSSGSALVGGLGGMNQTQIRALLGYSSIGHLGWMMFAMISSEWIMKIYLGVYVAISLCMFVMLWLSDNSTMKNLDSLKNSGFTQLSVILMLLSLGGLPPLLGFISKWLVVLLGVEKPYSMFIFILILGSLMSLFYYLSLFFSLTLGSMKKYNLVWSYSSYNLPLLTIIIMNMLGGLFIVMLNMLFTF
uniref:NADH-ubiquinone oxidoreductase chain 2 n=1 Tax=Distorsio anus TaxID=2945631 RepID=A0A9E8ACT4_9CAEN|nr:NADH dehydrogenase subunit 2 [Distorsio anus]